MKSMEECFVMASEMDLRAESADDPRVRADWRQMALSWRRVAAQASWQDARDDQGAWAG